ncbi:hypothetical protein HDE_12136 [Halotydeus destructor]|nr:hypothetical protein HDE_12136 [Halotydeus destructor]
MIPLIVFSITVSVSVGLANSIPLVSNCDHDEAAILRLPSPNAETYKVYTRSTNSKRAITKLRHGLPVFENEVEQYRQVTAAFQNGNQVYLFNTTASKSDWNVCLEGTSYCGKYMFPRVMRHAARGAIYGVLQNGDKIQFTHYISSTFVEFVSVNADGNVQRFPIPGSQLRSGVPLSYANENETHVRVFFNYINGVHRLEDFPFTPRRDVDYKSNKPWLGCPQVMCLDGTLDAATSGPGDGYTLFRGRHSWKAGHALGLPLLGPILTDLGFIDAAFLDGHTLYTFRDHHLIVQHLKTLAKLDLRITDTFTDIVGHVDAAFISQSVVHIIQENIVTSYDFKPNTAMKATQRRYINDIWKNLPSTPDAAAMHLDGVNFFKDGFHYRFSSNGYIYGKAVQGQFFDCGDTFYSDPTVQLGFYKNLREFRAYRERLLPPVDVATGIVPVLTSPKPMTTEQMTNESSATDSPRASSDQDESKSTAIQSKPTAVIAFITIATLVALLAILVAILNFSTEKDAPPVEIRNSLIETLTNEALPSVKETTSLTASSNVSDNALRSQTSIR